VRQLVFALRFRDRASLAQGTECKLEARTSATSQVLRTVLTAHGVEATVEAMGGGLASFESEIHMTGDSTFQKTGTITYGAAGKVAFTTMGQGVLGPSSLDALQCGAVIWEMMGGDGKFVGGTGLITSNFTVSPAGEVVDNQVVRLFLWPPNPPRDRG
jgi:hypothetical protein